MTLLTAKLFLEEKNDIHDFAAACKTTGFGVAIESELGVAELTSFGMLESDGEGSGGLEDCGVEVVAADMAASLRRASSLTNSASVFAGTPPSPSLELCATCTSAAYPAQAQRGPIHPVDEAVPEVTEGAGSAALSTLVGGTFSSVSPFPRGTEGGTGIVSVDSNVASADGRGVEEVIVTGTVDESEACVASSADCGGGSTVAGV